MQQCPICQYTAKTENSLLKNHIYKMKDKEHSCLFCNEENKDNWVECKICGFRSYVITQHIIQKHNIKTEQYERQFGKKTVFSKKYYNDVIEKFHAASLKIKRICMTSEEKLQKNIEKSHKINNDQNIDDWVECKICEIRMKKIVKHIRQHNITVDEYKQKYKAECISKNYLMTLIKNGNSKHERERFLGKKNPFFGHNHTADTRERIRQKVNKNYQSVAKDIQQSPNIGFSTNKNIQTILDSL